jgi:hypothetical protein
MRVLIRPDRDHGGFGLVQLGIEDVGHLGDDRLHVGHVGLAVEAVDGLELREVRLDPQFEGQVLDLPVGGLAVEIARLGVEPQREQAQDVVAGVLVDLAPREPAGAVGLQVRDQGVGVPALLLMPDDLVEDHLVADVGVTGRHEPRERGPGLVVAHRLGDGAVVAVAEDHAPAHQVVWVGHLVEHLVELLDAELLEQLAVVRNRRGAPRVQRHVVGSGRAAIW